MYVVLIQHYPLMGHICTVSGERWIERERNDKNSNNNGRKKEEQQQPSIHLVLIKILLWDWFAWQKKKEHESR